MPNNSPIFTRVGDIQGGATLTAAMTAGTAYTGVDPQAVSVFVADATNGGFVQRIRFKANGTNSAATVARIFINEGVLNQASPLSAPGTPSATTSTSNTSSLYPGTFYARVAAIDQWGGITAQSADSTAVTVGQAGNIINWTWSASTGAKSYRLFVGPSSTAGAEFAYFTTTTNSYAQTAPYISGQIMTPLDFVTNNMFYGEISLPATTPATATAATTEIDYPMNIALPPGWRILVGLGTAPNAAGWTVTVIGGKY